MAKKTILILDDEELIRKVLDVKLKSLDYNTLLAKDGPEALDLLEKNKNKVDIVFCDVFLPGMSGFDVLKEIKKKYKDNVVVIIMTAYANLKNAVKAFDFGAFDYLIKPFTMEEIPYILNKAIKFKELLKSQTKQKKSKPIHFSEIVGTSDYIIQIKNQLSELIKDYSPCLIQGNPGTGKKYIAKVTAINFSKKLNDDFYYINLLGYSENKENLINTIFNKDFIKKSKTNIVIIDNIHLIDLALQEKALKNISNEVKYIFITNKKIQTNYKRYFSNSFFDLFKENIINTIPLKEHKEDIPLLIQHFIKIYNDKYKKTVKDIDKDSFYYLLYYDWPDNIMELESILEKVILLAEGKTITSELLYDFIKEQKDLKVIILNPRLSYHDALQASRDIIDKHFFKQTLKVTNNNKTKAAKLLGISLRQFQYKCKSLGL